MPESKIFVRKETGALFQTEKLEKLRQCVNLLGDEFKVRASAWTMATDISTSMFVSITYKEYGEIMVVPRHGSFDGLWHPIETKKTVNLFVTPDGKVFRKHEIAGGKNKVIPLTMVELLNFMKRDNLFGKTMRWMVDYFGKNNRFVYDVINDCKDVECLIPATFNDILDCYNKTHFFNTKYKSSIGLNVNWNKKNINLSYMILKAYPKIEDGVGRRIVLQQNDTNLLYGINLGMKIDAKVRQFITNVIKNNVLESEKKANERRLEKTLNALKNELTEEVNTVLLDDEFNGWVEDKVVDELNCDHIIRDISDYVRMCFISKKKVKIDVKSVRQLTNMHDRVAHGDGDNHYRRHAGQVTIPKNTKFKKLREILPDEFEWIQSRKRLILETELQHHCVWSYAGKISSDNCAIYSFVDVNAEHTHDGKPKRYTIEFDVDRKGKYGIVQVQGKYDRVHTEAMYHYIQTILDEKQKEKNK